MLNKAGGLLTSFVLRDNLIFLNDPSVGVVLNLLGLVFHVYSVKRSHSLLKFVHSKRWLLLDEILTFILTGPRQVELHLGGLLVIHVPQPHALKVVLMVDNATSINSPCVLLIATLFVSGQGSFTFNNFVLFSA